MRTVLLAALIAILASPAGAQLPREPLVSDPEVEIPNADRNAPVDCRAVPDVEGATGTGPALPDTSILDECGSVLAPPVTGDNEIVTPPSQGGETPVIDPSVVPPPMAEEE